MLHEKTKALASGKNFAVLTTLLADGTPQSHVMWVSADDTHIYINTELHRQKFKNVERDPRATVTIVDADNPYSFVEVRGTVVETIGGQQARDHIDELSERYFGRPYSNEIQSERVILKIRPDREVVR
ncbi:MAG: PPOX class F420-dependent oxidoreductase [Acidimicrobiia bacterium]